MINDKIDKPSLTKSIDNILVDFARSERRVYERVGASERIKALIEEVFEECKPEKQYTTVGLVVDPHDLSKGGAGKVLIENGYNQAIRDFEANFKKVMGK